MGHLKARSMLTPTIAICTTGKHPRLLDSVMSILGQERQDLRLIVVDNDPSGGGTVAALSTIHDDRLMIVEEPARGLSRARNRAIAACKTNILAFTDDDAIADPAWIDRLLRPFDDSRVWAVTGLVLPAELRTEAQRAFEAYVSFSKGDKRRHWTLAADGGAGLSGEPGPRGPLFPLSTGKVGSGNNMAFRIEALRRIGGFDPALGAGTLAQGGEDLDAFSRVLLAGGAIVYVPDAVVRHYHRPSMAELEEQIHAQGVGMGALLAKSVVRHPMTLVRIVGRASKVAQATLASRGRGPGSQVDGRDVAYPYRNRLLRLEMQGLIRGPWRYVRSCWAAEQ